MKAIWNNQVIAESENTIVVEGNHYFPADAIKMEFLKKSDTLTTCPWKGEANYFDVEVADVKSKDAAWVYPETSELAKNIKGLIAFWRGVSVVD